MLQVRWPGTLSHKMHRRKPEMPALRAARGTVGAEDGRTGLRFSEKGNEKKSNPRLQVVKRKARRCKVPETLNPRARRSARRTPWKR